MTCCRAPIGELCVLPDKELETWSVAICHGALAQREILGRFRNLDQAAELALEERDRQLAQTGIELPIHFPDDCPCSRLTRGCGTA